MLSWALALWTGALLGACQIDWAPVAWLALAPLAWACARADRPAATRLGFASGAVAGAALYGLIPYGKLLYGVIVVYCGLNMAFFGWATALIAPRASTALRVALPALLWTGLEYLRRYGPISFPIMLGPTQTDLLPLWQVAAWAGGHGLSFLIALPAGLVLVRRSEWMRLSTAAMATLGVAGVLGTSWWLGAARMAADAPPGEAVPVAGVQSALENWAFRVAPVSTRHRAHNQGIFLDLTRRALRGGAKLVVWPETVVQEPLFSQGGLTRTLQELSDRFEAAVLVGAVREGSRGELYNSAVVFRPREDPIWQDKIRLAGYSEARLTPGTTRKALITAAGRLGVMICLESVYPQDARALVADGADLLITTTDDAGFRWSPVAEFHVRRAALRSIETGRWQLHLSQAGPSSITDPLGRTVARSDFWERGLITGEVRRTAMTTPYQIAGDTFSWTVWALIVWAAWGARGRSGPRRRATQKSPT